MRSVAIVLVTLFVGSLGLYRSAHSTSHGALKTTESVTIVLITLFAIQDSKSAYKWPSQELKHHICAYSFGHTVYRQSAALYSTGLFAFAQYVQLKDDICVCSYGHYVHR